MKKEQYRDWTFSSEPFRADINCNFQTNSTDINFGDQTDMDPTIVWRMGKLGKIGSNRLRLDDDFTDRLNYQFSTILIFILISMTGVRQYFGKPIQCWIPQEFTRGWEEYAESYCYVSNTYFNPIYKSLPKYNNRKERIISYYQWASIMLAVQALLFCIPCILWRLLILKSGFNLQRIMQVAKDANSVVPDHLHKSIKFIAIHMDKCLKRKKIYGTGFKAKLKRLIFYLNGGCCARNSGNYLSFVYIIIKILYLLNVVGQLYLMQKFIGTGYLFYGVQVLYDLVKGAEWPSSGHFPRVTFCDFEAKKLGKNHLYTLQCVLPLNMFLEKIFIFLWFWHIIIGCITAIGLISWFNKLMNRKHQFRFIKEYLKLMELVKKSEESWRRNFIFDYLRTDGLFIIHLISINISDIVAADVVCELWNLYRNQRHNECEHFKSYDEPNLSGYKFININKEIGSEITGKLDTNDDIV